MPSNSALMQSYNLMKMSSEVTKTQAAPQFMGQERSNNQYGFNAQPAPQTNPQPNVDFNMPMYAQQRVPTNQQLQDQNSDANFLGIIRNFHISSNLNLAGISPSEMGMPSGVMGRAGSPPIPKPEDG